MSMTDAQILQCSEELKEYTVHCRRMIHHFAEPSRSEFKTSMFIQKAIEDLGLPYQKIADTALMAVLDTGKAGPHVVLRADIDALPLSEEPSNLKGPRVCISDQPNTCHACGHDAHSAMLMSAMRALAKNRNCLTGIIYFIFEEGEENGASFEQILDVLASQKIDTCWAIHVYAGMDSGKICVDPGPRMAGSTGISYTIIGKGGHGSRPDMAKNPVFCAATSMTNLAVAWVNQITTGKTVTLGITSIQSETTNNVIADKATVIGTMRFFDMQEGDHAQSVLRSVVEHTAAMNNCKVEFGRQIKTAGPPVINDKTYAELAKKGLSEILPTGSVISSEPWYASESFSRYCASYPSVMAHLGINNPQYGSGAPHHNGFFDVDEQVLPIGLISTLKYVAMVECRWSEQHNR